MDTVAAKTPDLEGCELILGNSNPRFSGVTSTMLQTLPHQLQKMNLRVLGEHHLPDKSLAIGFFEAAKLCRRPLKNGACRIFHARRNDEMIQALLLKHLFRAKIKIVFTSTAQRHHTGFSRWLMGKMDAVISTCQAAAAYLETPPARIIPHGVQTDVYHPAQDRALAWQSLNLPGKRGIGIFGRVRRQKGVHLFVRACLEVLPRYPDTSAIIVGSLTPKNQAFADELMAEIRARGLEQRILFLGEQPFEKIPTLFQSVSLVAALSENEGFGLTVLEAMSSGTAVIATKAGAWEEVIREGVDGTVIPVNDLATLTQKLDELLASSERLEKMGKNGRDRILSHYTVEREANALCEFYRELQSRR